ncbi:MAG: FAD-binding oxidoreductase [Acidobacteriota bacterium]
MIQDHKILARLLESVVGTNNLLENQALHIDSITPPLIVKPAETEQVAECLNICAKQGAAVIPAGAMSWLECGNPLRRGEVILSLQNLSRVIDYSPADLTVTVEAGISLQTLNAIAKTERQWLPFDPPGSVDSTLGAIAACASSGALRFGFGTPRDYVIGLRLAHIDGTESKCGGRVVKNVAGYDLNKLYVGSFGTLAVITELNFKLRPLPEQMATLMIAAKNPARLADIAKAILNSTHLQPASIYLISRISSIANEDALLVRFGDSETVVKNQIEETTNLLDEDFYLNLLNEDEAERLWSEVANLDTKTYCAVRISVPLASATSVYEKLLKMSEVKIATADVGVGIIRLGFEGSNQQSIDLIKQMRVEAACLGGTLFVERAPEAVRQAADAWNDVGTLAPLMKGMKRNFDPESLLNPGKFVAGI